MAYATPANMGAEDPRVNQRIASDNEIATEKADHKSDIDSNHHHASFAPHYKPSFEESMYWATLERDREKMDTRTSAEAETSHYSGLSKRIFNRKGGNGAVSDVTGAPEKEVKLMKHPVTQDEKDTAYRALRTASWLSIFYLITTDILGPYSTPWAFSHLGYASGCLIFFFFGAIAMYTGFLLWWMYLKLDSSRFPVRTYSDLGERIYTPVVRHGINILQTVQLIFNVALIILGNGQGLSQVAKNRVCFSALCLIWTIIGMLIGQIRSLKNYGWLANGAIWMNLLVLFMTMGVVAHSGVNITANISQGVLPNTTTTANLPPIQHGAFIKLPFTEQLLGAMQIVYSYGGAMLFIEFMAEMRRPWDFWKSMIAAQTLIFVVYMFFGLFVFAFQGQYAINPANQGINPFGWQTATNIISFIAALIAAGLYGNIGIKVLYANVLEELFGFPAMTSRAGRYVWIITAIVYWSIAFVIGSGIPQFSAISGIVAALCILQFTYSFPPLLWLGFHMHVDAVAGDRPYDPQSTAPHRVDSWRNWSRWRRALGGKHWYFKLANLLLGLAALATAGLGAYSSILGIIAGFASGGHASSFGCQSPVA